MVIFIPTHFAKKAYGRQQIFLTEESTAWKISGSIFWLCSSVG